MYFSIGAYKYSVRRRWTLKLDGDPVDGYCASTVRVIFLDGDLDDDAMVATLRHEHAHAWEFEVGAPSTMEDRANFAATVGAAFDAEFSRQGGLDALKELPIEGLRPTRTKAPLVSFMNFADRIECGSCGAQIMCGSIFTSEPRTDGDAGITVVDRGCQCPVCDRVQAWTERATPGGMPLGEYYSARLLSGEEANAWLRTHRLHSPYNVG